MLSGGIREPDERCEKSAENITAVSLRKYGKLVDELYYQVQRLKKKKVYFTDPYCAWQKGTNENLNGLLREFYPKGRNLSRVSPQTLKKNLALINARPKKVLGFKKPVDLFDLFLSQCCT